MNGEYIQRPGIYAIAIYDNFGDLPFTTHVGNHRTNLAVSCGSLVKNYAPCEGNSSCSSNYTWTTLDAGVGGTACKVTASATNEMLTDSFSAGVLVK